MNMQFVCLQYTTVITQVVGTVIWMCFFVQLLGHMLTVAEQVVTKLGTNKPTEYRVIINNKMCREPAAYHPQIHVMAGRKFDWPPG